MCTKAAYPTHYETSFKASNRGRKSILQGTEREMAREKPQSTKADEKGNYMNNVKAQAMEIINENYIYTRGVF